jgi:cytochrome c peroxidase
MKHKLLIVIGLISFIACNQNNEYLEEEYTILSEKLNLPENPFDYTPAISEGILKIIPELGESLENNPLRDHQATLGRVLFYDTRLSQTEDISCASCHLQSHAFSDNVRVSKGIEGRTGHRNALALATTMGFETSYGGDGGPINNGVLPPSSSAFFSWDDSVFDLTDQSRRAIESNVEMNMTMHEAVTRLEKDRTYGVLFKNAFGSSQVNEHNLLVALKVFMNSLSSVESKFDEGLASTDGNSFSPFPNFSTSENRGKEIFNRDCASCHSDLHSFSIMPVANNGLDIEYEDQGKGEVSNNDWEMGVFKIPFLRNIALTAPYMHDGRFGTLEEVIEHYSINIQNHRNLNFELRNNDSQPRRFNYTKQDKLDLIAYLNTLTDYNIINDVRFSNPFK